MTQKKKEKHNEKSNFNLPSRGKGFLQREEGAGEEKKGREGEIKKFGCN